MDFFEKIGDAANKTYKYTAEKTTKIAKETKLRMQINEYKGNIKDLYIEIGEDIYEKYVIKEDVNLDEIHAKCEMIKDISNKIVECKDEILKIKEKRQCKNCFEEIDLYSNYCPNCGAKKEKIEVEEPIEEETENSKDLEEADENKNEEN